MMTSIKNSMAMRFVFILALYTKLCFAFAFLAFMIAPSVVVSQASVSEIAVSAHDDDSCSVSAVAEISVGDEANGACDKALTI